MHEYEVDSECRSEVFDEEHVLLMWNIAVPGHKRTVMCGGPHLLSAYATRRDLDQLCYLGDTWFFSYLFVRSQENSEHYLQPGRSNKEVYRW